ncbi:MAG: glycine cleavage system aminomethyltransferase GcvT, partial [Pirellulaceae bacterium]
MNESLSTTPLHSWHIEQGARLVDFAGWEMPVQYNSIVEEHLATRQGAGLFDVSHMGRVRFDGAGAARFLDRLLTRRVLDLQVGQIRYSLITNEEGNVLDDVLVYHLQTPSEIRYHMLVVNASNRLKILDWLTSHQTAEDEVRISDCTLETAMIAVQGPRALQIVDPLVDVDLNTLRYYKGVVTRQMGKPCTVSRTGYTGEDGVELIVHADKANQVVNNLFASGRDLGIRPVGLGARDTLRLEAALPLYGHELDESTSPFQAGLDFAVNLEDAQQ